MNYRIKCSKCLPLDNTRLQSLPVAFHSVDGDDDDDDDDDDKLFFDFYCSTKTPVLHTNLIIQLIEVE